MHPIFQRTVILLSCIWLLSACSLFHHDEKVADVSVNTTQTSEEANQKGAWQSFKTWCSDSSITTSVKFKLIKDPYIDAINVKVITEAGVVTLSGYVQKQSDMERAEDLAKSTEGVTQVENKLLIIFG